MSRNGARQVRLEVAAIPLTVLAVLAFRAKSLTVGVGADEYSLVAMAGTVLGGGFPYADFWDVRPPLAYLWGLPSAYIEDAGKAVMALRLLALLAQGVAAWTFFCLFCRQLGSLPASLGAATLLASANMVELHHAALPNHFAMAISVGAFACAVEGIRRNLKPMYLVSAVLAGLLPWTMVHAALAALAVAVLAILGTWPKDRRWAWSWLAAAALPTIIVVGAYALWGPFDTFVRTVFLAPFDVVTEGFAAGVQFFPDGEEWIAGVFPEALHYVLLLAAGTALLPRIVGDAASGSPLRLSPYLVLPPIVPLVLMACIKSGAPEYWIDAAPGAALLAAVAAHRLFSLKAWAAFDRLRHLRPPVLRGLVTVYLWLVLFLLTRPEAHDPALPPEYCEAAAWWMQRLEPERTVFDNSGVCGYWILASSASLHPPFTFAHNWFRQLNMPWIGMALAGDGSEMTALDRWAAVIGRGSTAGIILADARFHHEVRERHWGDLFFKEWEPVWYRTIDGYGPEERFSRLAVFVRRDLFLDAREEWLEAEACGEGCVPAKEVR